VKAQALALVASLAVSAASGADYVVEGRISSPDGVQSVSALRWKADVTPETFRASFDPKTGAYRATLPGPGTYNLVIESRLGRIEGVTLSPADEFGLVAGQGTKPTTENIKHIKDYVSNVREFMNKKRVLAVAGTGKRVRALVEKIRDRKTTLPSREPFIIWRVELFTFEKAYDQWSKVPHTEFVLYRKRMPVPAFDKLNWVFEPALGGIELTKESPAVTRDFKMPQSLDPAFGKVGPQWRKVYEAQKPDAEP
jgi:hypothetical protein